MAYMDRNDIVVLADEIRTLSDQTYMLREEGEELQEEVEALADKKAPAIINSASGAIASFFDGADDVPLKGLKFNIKPKQDLHGYSYPWPGGGGVNLINFPDIAQTTSNGVTYSMSGGVLSINGTATGGVVIYPTQAARASATYTMSAQLLSGSMSGTNSSFSVYSTGSTRRLLTFGNTGVTTKTTFTGDIVAANAGIVINSGAVFTNAKIAFQVEAGSDMTAFAPYSNISPISGWSQVDAWQTGGNLLNYDAWKTVGHTRTTAVFENNGVTLTATGTDGFTNYLTADFPVDARIPVKVGEPITLSWDTPDTAVAAQVYIFPNGATAGLVSTPAATKKLTYTPTAGITYVTFRLGVTTNGTTVHYKNLMVNFGTAAAAYTPFTDKRAITISLGQTVYGGTVDALNGKLVIDRAKYTYGATPTSGNPVATSTGVRTGIPCPSDDINKGKWSIQGNATPIFDKYGGTISKGYGANEYSLFFNQTLTKAQIDAMLANMEIVYYLATPIEVDLTPVSGLTSLLGQNNIWASCGDTEVEYVADTKLYIQRLTAPTEDDMIANENIASGKFFMIGNDLYLSTAAIVAGETIVPGTNCTKLSLAEALNNINA